jgi:ferritin-like metal-binding protein YciE
MKGTLQELFVEQVKDLFDAEKQLTKALPKMAKSASDPELQTAFREHLEETKGQIQRLEQVFELVGTKAKGKPCMGMKGLVEEGQEVMDEDREPGLLDSAITGAARKVEHYEIAGYETARSLAQSCKLGEAVQLLQENLDEEIKTDKRLAQISKRLLKEATSQSKQPQEQTEESAGRRRASAGGNSRQRKQSNAGRESGGGRGLSKTTTDHEEIRRWAEERGAKPASVKGTGGSRDVGMIRLDFPGYSGEESLEAISWDEWFEEFDKKNLALLYQEKTARGQKSNFNKLVSRRQPAKTRAAG